MAARRTGGGVGRARPPMILKEAYPLRKPYSYAAIKRDPITEEIIYEVVEPTLTEEEKEILDELKEKLLDELRVDLESLESREKAEELLKREIERVVKKYKMNVSKETLNKLFYYISRDFIGYGKIEPLMIDPFIEDISCDGPGIPVYVWHRDYESIPTNVRFETEEELSAFIIRLAYRAGKHISVANPIVEARLPDGSRAVLTLGTEVTRRGSTFTIRKFRREPFTIVDLIRLNTVSAEMAAYFWYVIENKASIIIAGAIASGKTTLLNCLSMFIRPEYKIVTVEETPELNLPHENWIPSVTRAGYGPGGMGAITLFDLVKAALRQRPDYIIVGEVRGEEAYVLFQAMATGHLGFCCVPAGTKVLMGDGSVRPIEELFDAIGSEVPCIDEQGRLRPGRISGWWAFAFRPHDTHLIEVETETGRRLRATRNHPFWTRRGWVRADQLRPGDFVAVYPFFPEEDGDGKEPPEPEILVSEEAIRQCFTELKETGTPNYTIQKLKQLGLLPIRSDSPKLGILLRVLGFAFGDGYLAEHQSIVTFTSDRDSLGELARALGELGFHGRLVECEREAKVKTARGQEHVIRGRSLSLVFHSQPLWCLLRALGAPSGDKTKKIYRLPSWLFELPRGLKREFLRGFLGAELHVPNPSKASGKCFEMANLPQHKLGELVASGREFMEDLRRLLAEFGVDMGLRIYPGYVRRDGSHTVRLELSTKKEGSLINLLSIGLAFAPEKEARAAKVLAYLLAKKRRKEELRRLAQKTAELKERGLSPAQIARALGLPYEKVRAWLRRGVKEPQIDNGFPSFEEWVAERSEGLDPRLVWERVVAVREVPYDGYVFCLTVPGYHNFITNGFVTHNTIHAETIDRIFKRLESKPMNIPKIFFEAIDVIALQLRTERKGRPVRRTKVVAEVTGLDPETLDPKILEVFRWDPVTDTHVFLGRSHLLEEIAADKGISLGEVQRELERRKLVLEWMVRKNLRDYRTVANIIREYYADPRRVLMRARVGA